MCCKNLQLMWNLPQVGSQWSRPPFAAALVLKQGLFESNSFCIICSCLLNALTLTRVVVRVVWSIIDAFENYLGHLWRPNPARGDRVHSDPVFREVQRHVLCQNVDRALGRSIGPPRKVCTCSLSAQLACLVESGEQICCSDSPRCSSLSKSGLASAPLRLAPWSSSQPHSPGETLKHFRKHCLTMKPTDSVKIDLDEGKNIFTIACKAPSLSYPNPPL